MRLALCGIAWLICVGDASAACLQAMKPGQRVAGLLLRQKFEDPLGRPVMAFILRPDAPACLESDPAHNPRDVDRIHVYSVEKAMRRALRRNVGKQVRITGDPFSAQTEHHQAPIVMEVSELAAK